MMITMKSKEMLPNELRGTFELPVWPYYEGPGGKIPPEFREYLRQYTVFHYEDDYHGENAEYMGGILIPDDNGVWPSDWESPIHCFQHLLWVDDDTLTVIEWPNDRSEGRELYAKILETTGDAFAWGQFNKSVVLHRVTANHIHYIQGHNVPGNTTVRRDVKI